MTKNKIKNNAINTGKNLILLLILNIKENNKKDTEKLKGKTHKDQDLPPNGIQLTWEKLVTSLTKTNTPPKKMLKKQKRKFFIFMFYLLDNLHLL
jgi:hypothetical protein